MSDQFEDYMGFRRGENEPAPEEPGRYDDSPAVAEPLAKRDDLQRQIDGNMANARMLLDAIWGNFKQR